MAIATSCNSEFHIQCLKYCFYFDSHEQSFTGWLLVVVLNKKLLPPLTLYASSSQSVGHTCTFSGSPKGDGKVRQFTVQSNPSTPESVKKLS